MLSQGYMGVFALLVLWVNTLLIAGAALLEVQRLWLRWRYLARHARKARVVEAPEGHFAVHHVEQLGRHLRGEKRAIVFHDRAYKSEILGGTLAFESGASLVLQSRAGEVWVQGAIDLAPTCGFDAALSEAAKARGFARTLSRRISVGDTVVIAGHETSDAPLFVALGDPVAWCLGRVGLGVVFIACVLVMAAGVTALCIVPPLFGFWSTLGGALGIAFFLAVQPIGTWHRDLSRPPSRAIVRGTVFG